MVQASAPLTVKNLDDYRVWSVKHRHWTFEVIEDDLHNVWVSTEHLRAFYDRFPKDKDLKGVYRSSLIYAKDVKNHYLSEKSMRIELRKSRIYSSHNDVLIFLDWFDRNVTQVATKKRANVHLDQSNDIRQQHESHISDRSAAMRSPAPQLKDETTPFTQEERWAMEQDSDEVRRVYHPQARVIRMSWGQWGRQHFSAVTGYLHSFFRGERNLFLTFIVGLGIASVPAWFLGLMLPESLDWTVSYQRVMWAFALVVPIAIVCALIYAVGMTRSTLHAWSLSGGKIWASTFYLLTLPLAPLIFFGNYDADMVEYWWASVRDKYQPITVYADPHLGRIVVNGPMEFGSADAVERELDRNPKFTLLQIESPGGKVIEGMRMSQLVTKRKMDTVSLELCASSCTFVLAAGADRYLGPQARIGFHRSGTRYGPVSIGWSETDFQMARYYRDRGVESGFIDKALTPSIRQIWFAPHADMYTAGFANLMWSERKAGY